MSALEMIQLTRKIKELEEQLAQEKERRASYFKYLWLVVKNRGEHAHITQLELCEYDEKKRPTLSTSTGASVEGIELYAFYNEPSAPNGAENGGEGKE